MKPLLQSNFRTFLLPERAPSCPSVVPLYPHHNFEQGMTVSELQSFIKIWGGITPGSQKMNISVTVMQASRRLMWSGNLWASISVVTDHLGAAASDVCGVCKDSDTTSCSIVLPFSSCLYFYFHDDRASQAHSVQLLFISSGLYPSITQTYCKSGITLPPL